MDLETFEKRFKEIIMCASQTMLTKQGDKLPGQIKIDSYKQTSNFTGKPIREVAFMEMVNYLGIIKNMCLNSESHTHDEWKNILVDIITSSAILYSLCPEEGSVVKEQAPADVEGKK